MKVAAVGDNCVDVYKEEGKQYPGGNPVNVAVYLERMGVRTSYTGVVGTDEQGKVMIERLQEKGAPTTSSSAVSGVTRTKTSPASMTRVHPSSSTTRISPKTLWSMLPSVTSTMRSSALKATIRLRSELLWQISRLAGPRRSSLHSVSTAASPTMAPHTIRVASCLARSWTPWGPATPSLPDSSRACSKARASTIACSSALKAPRSRSDTAEPGSEGINLVSRRLPSRLG